MPVNRKMMRNLKKRYGKQKGKTIYYKIENLRKHGKKVGGRRRKRR